MYYIKKLVKMIFSIFLIGTLSFLLLEMIPGDPASAILGVESSPEDIELLREALGLNKSLIVRYLTWGKGVLAGDFGNSFKYSEPVVDLILKRLPLTLEIALISIGIVFLVSVPLSFLLYKIKNKNPLWYLSYSQWIILSCFVYLTILTTPTSPISPASS